MSTQNAASNGPQGSTSATPVVFDTITTALAGVQTSRVLYNDGLVGIRLWILQTGGAIPVQANVQFGAGNTVANAIDWQPLVPAFVLAIGVPALNNWSLAIHQARVQFTFGAGGGVVRYWLTGALT